MADWWNTLEALDRVFFCCAVGGGTLFVFWMALQFLGGFDHGGGDVSSDVGDIGDVGHVGDVGHGDIMTDAHGDVSGDADMSFKVLSFQGLSSFVTMFGFVGLALRQNEVSALASTGGGTVAGFLMLWVMKHLFGFFVKMQSSGTLNMANAVGSEGKVYLKIPAEGTGKAEVVVQGRLQIFEAISADKLDLPTGTPVKVVRIISGETVAVQKL
jgi:hypothetical protein